MVAYSFAPQFVPAVESLVKRQTVRGHRKRHARPSEPVQLYTAMRTRQCRKLVDPDPLCIAVDTIAISVSQTDARLIRSIVLNERLLTDDEIELFAIADGFGAPTPDGLARQRMGAFWVKAHADRRREFGFDGVVIRWDPA